MIAEREKMGLSPPLLSGGPAVAGKGVCPSLFSVRTLPCLGAKVTWGLEWTYTSVVAGPAE